MTATYPARTAKRGRNREALLAAALELSADRGYHGVSVEEIASRAGVTTGAVYSIFGGKRELFAAALRDGWRVPSLADAAPLGVPLRDAVARLGMTWGQLAADRRAAAAFEVGMELAMTTLRDEAGRAAAIADWNNDRDRLASELERYAAAAGETLPVPAVQLATRLVSALGGMSMIRIQTGQLEPTDFAAVARSLLHR